ncbi:hypothetical protein [Cyanothece sp. BG0011]|uniref:hypothetical protein n=1 Tax=Cyanothece sp. BG0011 TaxID=2082950 RepID=UPI000D1DB330|nr:hypothetical protein [Cyanothece sp. BG0011]
MTVNIVPSGNLQEVTPEKLDGSSLSLKKKLSHFFHKETINPDIIIKHNQALEKANTLQVMAQALEHKQFREKDFILLLQIKHKFAEGLNEYKGLDSYVRLFQVAIEAKNSFLAIEHIELLHRSSQQQNFYKLVFHLLEQDISNERFYQFIHQELTEVLPKIKTEKGKRALECYVNALDSLTYKDELGLKLLYLFKKYQLTNYSILQKVSNVVDVLKTQDIKKTSNLVKIVKTQNKVFEQLGKILEIPQEKNNPLTYATMLQYIVLRAKYVKVYAQFQKLIEVLGNWNKFDKTVESIRRQYSWNQYRQPKDFKKKLVMLDLYKKYHHYC